MLKCQASPRRLVHIPAPVVKASSPNTSDIGRGVNALEAKEARLTQEITSRREQLAVLGEAYLELQQKRQAALRDPKSPTKAISEITRLMGENLRECHRLQQEIIALTEARDRLGWRLAAEQCRNHNSPD